MRTNKDLRALFFLVVFALASFALSVVALPASLASNSQGKLSLSQPELTMEVRRLSNGTLSLHQTIELLNDTEEDIGIGKIVFSCSCLDIEMDRKIIPKKSRVKATVKLSLSSKDFETRTIEAIFIPEKSSTPPLTLTVKGSVAFQAYSDLEVIDFGRIGAGETKTREIGFFLSSKKPERDFVKKLSFTHAEFFNARILETESMKKKDGHLAYYVNRATIQVDLHVKQKQPRFGDGDSAMNVEFTNGEILRIPLGVCFFEKPVFEPAEESYLLIDLKPEQERIFPIIYNEDAGGKLIEIKTEGNGLSIIKVAREENRVCIWLRYLSQETAKDGKVARLKVESEKSKEYCLDIIADVQESDK